MNRRRNVLHVSWLALLLQCDWIFLIVFEKQSEVELVRFVRTGVASGKLGKSPGSLPQGWNLSCATAAELLFGEIV